MNVGIRGHDLEMDTLEDLANEIASKGLNSVQLVLRKSVKDTKIGLGSLTPGFAKTIAKTFNNQNVDIALLGCYINMIHPDLAERQELLNGFKEHIRYARDFNCSVVGTETGNVNAETVYTEDNFNEEPYQEVVKSVRELVTEAEKFGVIVGIEGGVNHPIYSPKMMKRLLDDIDSNNLQVIFDPTNYLTKENYVHQEQVIQEAYELFGDRIIILHAKDFIIDGEQVKEAPVGQGLLNYDVIFNYIKANKPHINIILEETKEPYINGAIAYLKEKYKNA
ncbi:sugar phosphate isomerase/epimerase family protein [Radiobacillus sp. PE A8.2]|uniref:sugar phosphate isomerase/epimerase family protein n=1 Tax=Radiobacillus sp. PE A8.2 TaxID=3380349 RepID=UPI00388EF127